MPILLKKDDEAANIKKYDCIEFDYLPEEEEFTEATHQEYYTATGGLIISKCFQVAAFSDPDNGRLFFGYDQTIGEKVKEFWRIS